MFHDRTIQRSLPPNLFSFLVFTGAGRNRNRIRLDGVVRLLSLLLMLFVDEIKVSHRIAFGGGSVRVLTEFGSGKLHTAATLLPVKACEPVVDSTPYFFARI